MARVKFSPIVSDIAGSIGGITFQKNSYGNSLRMKPFPIKVGSQKQLDQRSILKQVQYAWQALSDSQKKAWQNFSAFSASFANHNPKSLLSGYNLFLKYNILRLTCGLSILSTVSFSVPTFPSSQPTLETDGGHLYIYVYPLVDISSFFMEYYLSPPKNINSGFVKSNLRLLKLPVESYASEELTDLYRSAFGIIPQVDQFVLQGFRYVSVACPIFSKMVIAPTQVTIHI